MLRNVRNLRENEKLARNIAQLRSDTMEEAPKVGVGVHPMTSAHGKCDLTPA